MGKRISKRVREEACELLQVVASARAIGVGGWWTTSRAAESIDTLWPAEPLAHAAWAKASGGRTGPAPDDYAEAECLLRTGWTPKDSHAD